MRIRHEIATPQLEEETKGLMNRIRNNRWTPVVVMTVITLATVRACSKDVTININNYVSETDH